MDGRGNNERLITDLSSSCKIPTEPIPRFPFSFYMTSRSLTMDFNNNGSKCEIIYFGLLWSPSLSAVPSEDGIRRRGRVSTSNNRQPHKGIHNPKYHPFPFSVSSASSRSRPRLDQESTSEMYHRDKTITCSKRRVNSSIVNVSLLKELVRSRFQMQHWI